MKFGSLLERKLAFHLKQEFGCQLLRKGWPDFLVIKPNGKIFCVEVKKSFGHLKEHQEKVIVILKDFGIPCYVQRGEKISEEIKEELGKN